MYEVEKGVIADFGDGKVVYLSCSVGENEEFSACRKSTEAFGLKFEVYLELSKSIDVQVFDTEGMLQAFTVNYDEDTGLIDTFERVFHNYHLKREWNFRLGE